MPPCPTAQRMAQPSVTNPPAKTHNHTFGQIPSVKPDTRNKGLPAISEQYPATSKITGIHFCSVGKNRDIIDKMRAFTSSLHPHDTVYNCRNEESSALSAHAVTTRLGGPPDENWYKSFFDTTTEHTTSPDGTVTIRTNGAIYVKNSLEYKSMKETFMNKLQDTKGIAGMQKRGWYVSRHAGRESLRTKIGFLMGKTPSHGFPADYELRINTSLSEECSMEEHITIDRSIFKTTDGQKVQVYGIIVDRSRAKVITAAIR